LEKSLELLAGKCAELTGFFAPPRNRYVFFGCGSSYMLAKSAQKMFALKPGVDAYAVAGGDYLIDPDLYQPLVGGSVIVFLSRSGSTSEILKAAEELRKRGNGPFFSITMREGSALATLSDYTLTLPWAFDESVCQTRTVTNFYMVLLILSSIYDSNQAQADDVVKAVYKVSDFLCKCRPYFVDIVNKKDIKDVVVLADGALCGIAEEAALAFTEICLVPGKYFNLLDYRHGPKVLNSPSTLTIVVIQPKETKMQGDLLDDVKKHGGTTVVIRPEGSGFTGDFDIDCGYSFFPTYGIALIQAAQVLAFEKALAKGINPDVPSGLDAWISL
jgi:fructoselysine-6-P-deglycase FrlB-like protein